ncbi:hypothetical protein HOC35_01945 [Candidatus Woesearchaeota archaeon]|jgi:hypothetical protein|nr:hypothetical protein [Candidatus Woesearchaeota archaeon]
MLKKRGVSRGSSIGKSKSKSSNKISKKWHHHVKHHITHHANKAHAKVLHHYHRRKHIEYEQLPHWKKGMLEFNHRFFGWLIEFIEKAIPWMVLILLLIIVAELGHGINGLLHNWFHTEWHFLDVMAEFAHHYHYYVLLIDQTIISFFVLDLYFNFFKKANLWRFVKTYFLDILAVLPLGFIAGAVAKEVGTAQTATHIVVDTERIATRGLEVEKIAARSIEAEKVAAETFKFERITKYFKSQRFIRLFTRIPRLLRLHRLFHFLVPKKSKAKNTLKSKKRKNLKKKKLKSKSKNKSKVKKKFVKKKKVIKKKIVKKTKKVKNKNKRKSKK